jgi:transcriptional regulator with XRE-family HTH domain
VHQKTLADRLAERLRELSEKRGFRNALAKRMGVYPSAITPYVAGDRAMSLEMLEAISELSQIPLAELVAAPTSTIKELTADEAFVLRALRRWPRTVTQALVGFLTFFADEEPVAGQTRNMHELWRRMSPRDQDAVYGYALMRREGSLPPELEQALFADLSAASKVAVESQQRKTRRGK